MGLYDRAWWGVGRGDTDVRMMLAGPSITYGLVDDEIGRLVGFARVLTDDVYLAVVLDVIVRPDRQGEGLGKLLLDAIVADVRLRDVRSIELVCQPELVAFYQRWGFTDNVGQSRLMRRTDDIALTG